MTSETIGYHVGWLIDGTGEPALENRIVTTNAGRIQSIFDADDPRPQGMVITDLFMKPAAPAFMALIA